MASLYKDIIVDLPGMQSLAAQRRIVTKVERRLSVVQELEATLTANLAQAFEGKLV